MCECVCVDGMSDVPNFNYNCVCIISYIYMCSFKTAFNEVKYLPDGSHDLSTFWLRKTKKPVLAVLLVRRRDGSLKLYRGTNMEVSMPTGSLCAER